MRLERWFVFGGEEGAFFFFYLVVMHRAHREGRRRRRVVGWLNNCALKNVISSRVPSVLASLPPSLLPSAGPAPAAPTSRYHNPGSTLSTSSTLTFDITQSGTNPSSRGPSSLAVSPCVC